MKTNIKELDVDAWVNAIGNLSDNDSAFAYAIRNSTNLEIRNWLSSDRCPGELERAFEEYAAANGIVFDEDGNFAR